MSQIEINGSDTSTLHLLHVDLPDRAIERFVTMAGTGEWPLKYSLGATKLRPAFIETVDLRDLGPMSLSQYLSEAHDVPARALGADKPRIDALDGHVIILPPQAFENTSQTLHIATPLRHIGSYAASGAKGRGPALRSPSSKGSGAGGAPAAMGSLTKPMMIAVAALIVVAVAVLAFVFG